MGSATDAYETRGVSGGLHRGFVDGEPPMAPSPERLWSGGDGVSHSFKR